MESEKDAGLNTFAFTPGRAIVLATGEPDNGLTLESAEDQISILSDFNIKRDAAGLALARDLVDVLLGAIKVMKEDQQAGRLPQDLSRKKPTVSANPIA